MVDNTYWLSENITYQDLFNHTKCDLSDNPRSSDCPYESCKYNESVSSCPNGYVFDFSQVKYSAINRVSLQTLFNLEIFSGKSCVIDNFLKPLFNLRIT